MYSYVLTAGVMGIDGFKVVVEADISKGLPGITIVGMPDAAIKESKDRIKAAITNSFLKYPVTKKIVINLSPADIKKDGSHYDLPIALSILSESIPFSEEKLKTTAFLGELSLDGKLKPVKATTALILGLVEEKEIKSVIIPASSEKEASMVPDIDIFLAEDLKQVVEYMQDKVELPKVKEVLTYEPIKPDKDFSDIKGSYQVKRAAQIAAAGFHNLMMIGPPGSGKTMIASRMNTIMPPLSENEYIEVSKIYSFLGEIPDEIILRNRPFRAPHHTISYASLIGGGSNANPGEVVLAHGGILFMDEFLNFDRRLIQGLRQPIEDREVTISRVNAKYTYPSGFMLVAATNPCPCGFLYSTDRECTCSEKKIDDYLQKASGPILDRIDIFVDTMSIKYEELTDNKKSELSSADLKETVEKAVAIQKERFKKLKINYNSQMNPKQIEKYCILDDGAKKLMETYYKTANLTARSYHRILKVARTIADMDEKEKITQAHVAEAINFRKVYSKYWDRN
ncbi:YifB family Mg chelatase-like AAA ATPase [Criibacterium bergeronii]|uniref:ATP-binding protein n=1 Tax=Criibacterium bergeronii TaxID=1871336 RepID=A0A371INT4_9FIRM|nr:YifB family Mg chelatase-like AAA ATPase [Criibacterium bergeronii]RDY22100.1 ATP-binding protein [Criibacterium bergeronii]